MLTVALKNALSRPAVQAAAQNFGWLVADKFIRLFSTVWVGFVVARYLGPTSFGAYSYALSVVGIGVLLSEAGVEGVVRRKLIDDALWGRSILFEACVLRVVVAVACYAALLVIAFAPGASALDRELLLVTGLVLFQPALFVPDLWFQSRLESRLSVSVQTAALVLGAAGRLGLVAAGAPLVAFAWMTVAEVTVTGVFFWLLAVGRGLKPGWSAAWAGNLRRLWSEAWPLMASGLAVAVYMRIDAVMLRQLLDEDAVGYYAAAVRFTEIWLFVPGALAVSALPALLRARSSGGERYAARLALYCDVSAVTAYALIIPTAVFAPWLISLAYGPAYAEAIPVLRIHAWILVFASLGVVRGQFCLNEGLTRFHLAATVVGALLNVLFNLWLIPRAGVQGAAIATLAAQAVAAWLSSFFHRSTRELAWMQTRSLLLPWRALRHARTHD